MAEDEPDLRDRVRRLEQGLREVTERVGRLEFILTARVSPTSQPPPIVAEPAPVVTESVEPILIPTPTPVPLGESRPSELPAPRARLPRFGFPRLSGELEVLIGTSWLNRIGIIAIIAAAAFFLKYSIDNDWIGPMGRVGLTLLGGVVLLFGGERYQRRGLTTFGQGLSGGGVVVLYLGVFAAFEVYRLLTFGPAFVLMVLITAATTALAVRYDSKVIATLGLIGGFATPLVLGDGGGTGGTSQPVTPAVYAYFLALDAAGYGLVRYRRWTWFGAVVLVAAFLTPLIMAYGTRPNQSAALVYFLIVAAACLAVSAATSLVGLAWAALLGGFVLGPLAGAIAATRTSWTFELGYFAAVSVGTIVLATRFRWQGVALAALLAGTVAGILMALDGEPPYPWAVFIYLILVGGSALYAAVRHKWRWTEWIAAVVTGGAAALVSWDAGLLVRLSGATAVFLAFSLTAALASRRHAEVRLVTVILAAGIYGGTLLRILNTRDLQAVAALGLSAYHLAVGRVLLRRTYPQLATLVLAGLALTFLTIAVPLKLRAEAITLAWSVEMAVLAWAAGRLRNTWAGRAAAIVGALAFVRLLIDETPLVAAAGLVATWPGAAFAVGVASLAMAAYFTRSIPWIRDKERYIPAAFLAGSVGLLFWWGGWEVNGLGERGVGGAGSTQALLSAWFTLYGFALVVTGVVRRAPALRWAGIGLLGLTIGKVFLVDLAQVEMAYRILSLLVLGVLLLAASLVYGRFRTRLGTAETAKGGR